jgi:hypothetical protein
MHVIGDTGLTARTLVLKFWRTSESLGDLVQAQVTGLYCDS